MRENGELVKISKVKNEKLMNDRNIFTEKAKIFE